MSALATESVLFVPVQLSEPLAGGIPRFSKYSKPLGMTLLAFKVCIVLEIYVMNGWVRPRASLEPRTPVRLSTFPHCAVPEYGMLYHCTLLFLGGTA